MTAKADYKVSFFRSKYEQDLRKMVTQGCCIASCTNDGNAEQEEIEMNEFTKLAMALVERAKRSRKKISERVVEDATVTMLRPRG